MLMENQLAHAITQTKYNSSDDAHGCFALKTTHGKHLVELKRELNREVGYKGVQLVTISRPTAYDYFLLGTL